MLELHVVPDDRGRWCVRGDWEPGTLSEHPTATDAEMAAWWHAERRGADRIVVHDRYDRTRSAIPRRHAHPPGAAHGIEGNQAVT